MNLKEEYKKYAAMLPGMLQEIGVSDFVEKNHEQYIEFKLKDEETSIDVDENADLSAYFLENLACDHYLNTLYSESENLFDKAFLVRRNFVAKNSSVNLLQLFYLSITSLGSKKISELRLTLAEYEIKEEPIDDNWPELVRSYVLKSFLFLCRKRNGWEDVDNAIVAINKLRELQKEFENKYLGKYDEVDELEKIIIAGELVSLYNLARIIEITGTYLIEGSIGANPSVKIKRHFENAKDALKFTSNDNTDHFSNMIYIGCDLLIKNSIWYSTRTLGEKVKQFVDKLASRENSRPFIELWPSQQQAMQSNLFDTAKVSVSLEMPTSAGKTLMAEFAIMQSRALNPDSVVIFVVPTRALVNQTTLQLRKDFNQLGVVIESAVPVFELDPTEDELLKKGCDVLVSTPEKLELLIRTKHPIVQNISLVVVDEVHNISDSSRGSARSGSDSSKTRSATRIATRWRRL